MVMDLMLSELLLLPALDGNGAAITNLNIPAGFSELDAALFN